jgi:hypothetical protein
MRRPSTGRTTRAERSCDSRSDGGGCSTAASFTLLRAAEERNPHPASSRAPRDDRPHDIADRRSSGVGAIVSVPARRGLTLAHAPGGQVHRRLARSDGATRRAAHRRATTVGHRSAGAERVGRGRGVDACGQTRNAGVGVIALLARGAPPALERPPTSIVELPAARVRTDVRAGRALRRAARRASAARASQRRGQHAKDYDR